jgi:hypothetical protein
MIQSLSLRSRLKLLVYLGAGILFVVSLFDGGPTVVGLTIGRLAIVEAGLFALLTFFNHWVWRQRFVASALRSGPVLRGTWKGVVTNADTKKEYEAYLSIRQTFATIDVRLLTAESTSESTNSHLTNRSEGLAVLEYAYQNDPRPTVRSRSEIHFGATRLEAVGTWPTTLAGEYWTSRQTRGELTFGEHNLKLTQTFEAAQQLFEQQSQ